MGIDELHNPEDYSFFSKEIRDYTDIKVFSSVHSKYNRHLDTLKLNGLSHNCSIHSFYETKECIVNNVTRTCNVCHLILFDEVNCEPCRLDNLPNGVLIEVVA